MQTTFHLRPGLLIVGNFGQKRRYDDGICNRLIECIGGSNECGTNGNGMPRPNREAAREPLRSQAEGRLLTVINRRLQNNLGTSHYRLSSEANTRDTLK